MAPRSGNSTVVLTGKLAEIAALRKQETILLGPISEHLLEKHNQPSDRRADVVHPSEMASDDWCPRQTYYRIKEARQGIQPKSGTGKFSMNMENIFSEGHLIHRKWQGWLTDMGLLWGRWKCLDCDLVTDIQAFPGHCSYCGGFALEYAEVTLSAEAEWLVAGHSDGYVPDRDCLIEIKSIGMGTLRMDVPHLLRLHQAVTPDGKKVPNLDAIWRAIHYPLAPHVRQSLIYLWMAQLAGLKVSRMVLLYEFKPNQMTKEFVVVPNDKILLPLLAKAKTIVDALGGAELPDRAHAEDSAPCKNCPYSSECRPDENSGPVVTTTRRVLRRRAAAVVTPDDGRPGEGSSAPTRTTRRRAAAPAR